MNRWIFLGGSAVAGLLLYLIFKVSHTGQTGSGVYPEHGPGSPGVNRWNDLPPSVLPGTGRRVHVPEPASAAPAPSQGNAASEHLLDTKATVYLDGNGPGASVPSTEGNASGNPDALILSTLKTVLGASGREPATLARAAERIRAQAGGRETTLSGSRKVPAGSELQVRIIKTVDGPGNQMPVIARIRSASLSAFHLPAGTKILGYPEGMAGPERLRIRFFRILYPGGFEAHTTGFALSDGREGVPVSVSRHTVENMAKSMAQNSLMIGGEAVGSMGWSGTDMGSFMAMQEGGSALAQAGSQMPVPNIQANFRISGGTDCEIMIMETFPVPGNGKGP